MTTEITVLSQTILLRIDGAFVGSYDSMDQVDRVLDAYKGRSVR